MRQTKSMSQEYSIRWWRENGYRNPPQVDPVELQKLVSHGAMQKEHQISHRMS